MKTLQRIVAVFAAVCLLSAAAFAADLSGTWSSTEGNAAGGAGPTFVFAVKDGKLSGTFQAPEKGSRSVKISAASISGDAIRFRVERTVQKMKVVRKYSGKLEGDTIVGKVEGTDGQPASDWIAKRAKAPVSSG
jgi:hypothetical protein